MLEEIEQDNEQEAPIVDHGEPVPVEITDEIYRNFKGQFGEEPAALLQSKWGDKALHNSKLVEAVVDQHPDINKIYEEHMTETGGMHADGAHRLAQLVAEKSGLEDVEELDKIFPEFGMILLENFNEQTKTVSMAGIYQALAWLGKRSGYNFKYRSPRR